MNYWQYYGEIWMMITVRLLFQRSATCCKSPRRGVTHLINPLEEKGSVERVADRCDRRIIRVGLTSKGTGTADAMLTIIHEQLFGLLNHLGVEDSEAFMRLMSRAIEYLSTQMGT